MRPGIGVAVASEKPELSLVVPAFNEAQRIQATLRAMAEFLDSHFERSELIVVDDGSADLTAQVVRAVAAELPVSVRVIRYPENRGKGFALKAGFANARGERILFSDADLSTPIEEAIRLLAALDQSPIAVGSRKMPGARVEVHQPWLREMMGKVFTWLVRVLVADVSDATCGFKAFRGDVGRDLFSRVRIDDWSFDAELLYLARFRGHRIQEIPVRWRHEAGTKVDLRRDVWRSLIGLASIRVNALRGIYRSPREIDARFEVWDFSEADAEQATSEDRP